MPLTLAEIEEALDHLRAVATEERGSAWYSYADSLLERRQAIARADQRLEEIKAERG